MKLIMSLVYSGLNGINQITSRSLYKKDCTAYNKPFRRFLKNMMGYTGVMDEHHISQDVSKIILFCMTLNLILEKI